LAGNRKGEFEMKHNKVLLMGMLAVLLAFGLVLAGCDTGTGSGGNTDGGGNTGGGGNPFVGKWVDDDDTMEFKADLTWTWIDEDNPSKTQSGTYAPNGNTTKLTTLVGDEYDKKMTDGQTITIIGNSFVLARIKTFTKVN
jgi:hypothetical protein